MNTAYRVWDGEQMHYWDDEHLSLTIKNDGSWLLWHDSGGGCVVSSDDKDATLMWGTGLKDKNEKMIYEHDIASKGERVNEIIRSGGKFLLKINGCWGMELDSSFEVIGDVYRNPELLEGAE
ncbi:YopX family protein [Bacillus subtilis]|uniref:YopX family protein n=1 Tax=Bacillus subtilis TaxID=1423 RepID=UPI003F84498E